MGEMMENGVIKVIILHSDNWLLELVGWSHCKMSNVGSLYCTTETNAANIILYADSTTLLPLLSLWI